MAKPFIEQMPEGFQTQWVVGSGRTGTLRRRVAGLSGLYANWNILVNRRNRQQPWTQRLKCGSSSTFLTEPDGLLISTAFRLYCMADTIVVLAAELVEQGTHEELKAGGRYARLFSLQAAGYH